MDYVWFMKFWMDYVCLFKSWIFLVIKKSLSYYPYPWVPIDIAKKNHNIDSSVYDHNLCQMDA